ncbi:hypothetical protein JCM19037_519 [Geomicrobium sp. JCM 19037]|uniref:hypothetical protein n=1 Tax=Geomicrobium sp. JCM 19037 TaxID=1460634 RepID=UPI00045F46A9|nr:hypothetical protein [Geomicrobium sp. JCM 19037]GAK02293.1 hypothetical protein JCM19037_519 [Geomicrobium sp. JCM 19037]
MDKFNGYEERADFGYDVEFEGSTYRLLGQAQISHKTEYMDTPNDEQDLYYSAQAVSEEGEEATVYWLANDNWREIEDESEVCEWDTVDYIR